jgi:aminomethyltransferase
MKKTALNEIHKKSGGKMVDFLGWELPVQYGKGTIAEHMAVRKNVGLFDVSHMGQFEFKGNDAVALIQKLITNNAAKLETRQVLYSPMCYENGTIVDDVLCYRLGEDHFYMVVNASNIEKDWDWVKKNARGADLDIIKNFSDEVSLLALQGPYAEKTLQKLLKEDLSQLGFFYLLPQTQVDDVDVLMISRTGYTGEDGFEIMTLNTHAPALWETIMKAGEEFGIEPCGLGARDTLRFEAKLPLYGNDIDDTTTPVEAVLKFFIDTDKPFFNGKETILDQINNGTERLIRGFEMIDKGIPRHGMEIYSAEGERIGYVTSGTYAPFLEKNLGLGYIDKPYHKPGQEIFIDVRGKRKKAVIVKTPFYKKSYKS